MKLLCRSQLSEQEFKDLHKLACACQNHDGSLPALYQHLLLQKRSQGSNVLYYKNNTLIGFLAAFFFYENTAELSVLVHPEFRRIGIAKALYKAVHPLLKLQQTTTIHCSIGRTDSALFLQERGFTLLHYEYNLERSLNLKTYDHFLKNRLTACPANIEESPTLYAIQKACFSNIDDTWLQRLSSLFNDPSYTLLLVHNKDIPIGKAHLHWRQNTAWISDLAILPNYQRQGYGSELLIHCFHYIFNQGYLQVKLDVEITTDTKYLDFYLKHGFHIAHSYSFLSIKISQLDQFYLK